MHKIKQHAIGNDEIEKNIPFVKISIDRNYDSLRNGNYT